MIGQGFSYSRLQALAAHPFSINELIHIISKAFDAHSLGIHRKGKNYMVERRKELNRRYHRKEKLAKLKEKLAKAKDGREKDAVLHKIHALSPWWKEPVQGKK